MLYIFLGLVLVVSLAVILSATRGAQLKHMASTLNLQYQPRVESPLTLLSAAKTDFFNQNSHRFYHVLTWKDSGAFICVCEDRFQAASDKKASESSFTLVTAELTRGSFIPIIIAPRSDDKMAAHPALPPELTKRYQLTAPTDYQLPVGVVNLLKGKQICYLETTLYALVYHEYRTIPIAQIQQARFRVKQFIKELIQQPSPTIPVSVEKNTLTSAELAASALLTLQGPRYKSSASNGLRVFYIGLMCLFLVGILFIAQYYLHHLAR